MRSDGGHSSTLDALKEDFVAFGTASNADRRAAVGGHEFDAIDEAEMLAAHFDARARTRLLDGDGAHAHRTNQATVPILDDDLANGRDVHDLLAASRSRADRPGTAASVKPPAVAGRRHLLLVT